MPPLHFLLLCLLPLTHSWRMAPHDPFGKPCLNSTVPEGSKIVNCDTSKLLACSTSGKCECAPSDKIVMYDPEAKSCFIVPHAEDGFHCMKDFHCEVSSFGKWSRCSLETGTCECFANGTPTSLQANVCYTLRSNPAAEVYSSCTSNAECWSSNLGNFTRCNMASLQCECYDTGKNEVGYFEGRCVLARRLGDICEEDAHCKVVHGGARCSEHNAFLQKEKTCQCPDGNLNKCDGPSENSAEKILTVGLTTFLMGIVAMVLK